MLDRGQLETFSAVIQTGSFDRAATVLNITRGAVSQRIQALEESLSTILLVREKPIVATPKGKILLRHVRALKALEDDTFSAILPNLQERLPTPLVIAVNADSLATWFGPLVSQLLAEFRIALEIIKDDQDHTCHRLIRGEVVGCISSESHSVQNFEATSLGTMQYLCVATPAFVQKHFGAGLSIPSISAAPAILFDRKDALHDLYLEQIFNVKVAHYLRHFIPSPAALLDAIFKGSGYGLVPRQQVAHLLAAGQLVEIMPGARVNVPLYWHHWKLELPLARAMTQAIASHALKTLDQLA